MADISIQFYALPDEIADLVDEVVNKYSLNVIAVQNRPFKIHNFDMSDIAAASFKITIFDRIYLCIDEPNLFVTSGYDFGLKNPDSLRLDPGSISKVDLAESWLSARTNNAAAFRIWKAISKRLLSLSRAGVTAVNRESGVSANYEKVRFTDGAKRLEDSGTPMIPSVGPQGPKVFLGIDSNARIQSE